MRAAPRGDLHTPHWPPALPRHLSVPETNVFHNVEVSAARFPDKPFIVFYDTPITFRAFLEEAERIAGFLQHDCGVQAGDRVLLYLQNSPQWILAFHGILRANAVVVPVNPMNRTEELRHCVRDSGATVAFVPQDLFDEVRPLIGTADDRGGCLRHVIVATYSDFLRRPTDLRVPNFIVERRRHIEGPGLTAWADMVARALPPGPLTQGPADLCVMPYTSGTTGQPKGCMHTHRSLMSTLVGGVQWFQRTQDAVYLSVLPLFHVTGLVGSMCGPLYAGATLVLLPRWDRDAAAACVQRYRVDTWQAITAMLVDFLSNPQLGEHDLSSLRVVRGGGAAMPEAVAHRLHALTGQHFIEGYGMSETMAATHINPMHRPKPQCLGIPVFDVDARIVDPLTLEELAQGEAGEIIVHAPQVMRGYWNDAAATDAAFIERDGKRFLRTGDLARIDADGYFFMVDRLKRMINASGYKVWPAEVEALLYHHPAILEACVIGARDARRGETVKALVVLKESHRGSVSEQQLIDWAHGQMAVYKSPRIVEFVDALPKSGSGKVQWRELQARESARADPA
ncbi:MAG: long-chain fatty acid--CoA ligase [Burkholderiales bacterium]|nr:long-chain fatty acid--CoA ligase [Burkholderiales bacterium]